MQNTDSLKADFSAGFQVALIALPLSIGIALASGAPASAGLIAAIIGGMIGSWLGGGFVNINGPAAGLIVIVLTAVNSIGFRGMLAAAVVSAIFQMVLGACKLGRKGTAFPASVIHGMMAAIGIIIIAKQAHLTIGHVAESKNPLMLLAEIPVAFRSFDHDIALIGLLTLGLLIVWNNADYKIIKKIPGPLVAVIFGAIMAKTFGVNQKALLNVPSDFRNWIIFPDFSVMATYNGWRTAITLCLVGSLETVLSSAAVDKMDPLRRKTDLDRDLMSKGITNLVSALIGGLPMIAEIVRSSANVSFGARTWKANFFQGTILLIAVLLLPFTLNLIPVAALAAVLCMIGWRLGSPKHFKHALKIGKDNVVGFAVTLVLTLGVDLLVGILFGVLAQYIAELTMGLRPKEVFKASYLVLEKDELQIIEAESSLIFSNFLAIKEHFLETAKAKKNAYLDLTKSPYIDHSVMEQLVELQSYYKSQGLNFEWKVSPDHRRVGRSTLSARKKKIAAA